LSDKSTKRAGDEKNDDEDNEEDTVVMRPSSNTIPLRLLIMRNMVTGE
jgi:hypothetical protein